MSLSFSSVDTQLILHPSLTLPPLSFADISKSHLSVGGRPQAPRGTSYPSPPMSKSPTPTNRSFDEYSAGIHNVYGHEENSRQIHDHKLGISGQLNGRSASFRQPLGIVPSQQYLQHPKLPVLGSSAPAPVPAPTPPKPARRTKAHVQSACYNCKKAHLSCDVARPCNRCTTSGKCNTCFDVEHKKRGRPRLVRDEHGFRKPTRAQQERPAPLSLAIPTQPHPAHGRIEPRVLKSQDDGRHMVPEVYRSFDNAAFTFQPAYQPRFNMAPMAFLDLEMNIIRTNQAMNNMFGGGGDICGRNLDHFIAVADKGSLWSLKNKLREEKELREPSMLPPISTNDVPSVETADIVRLTQGYQDRAEFLTFQFPTGQFMLAVNIRLARTSCFFVTLMLQEGVQTTPQYSAPPRSAQSMPQAYPYSASLNVPGPWSGMTSRHSPQPASPYYTFGAGISPAATPSVNGSRNGSGSYESYFNPSLTSQSYPMYAYQNMGQQQHHIAYEPRQQMQAQTSELQLPPLATTGAPIQRRDTVQMGPDSARERMDSAVDMGNEYDRSSAKRQRVGVHHLLG